ncbi:MAG: Rieske 2Fe-2S domain-containing protein [Planctomycetes bacterium]|nr:Rieske 2Fe-2S domain-containing protein [Planctomycetota bacterium]
MSEMDAQPPVSRRSLLDHVIALCGTVTGVALVGPAVAYLWPVTKAGPVKSREEVGDAAGWAPWTARKASIAGKPVLIVRTDKGFIALSAVCTHLGCLVEYDAAKKAIACPCHGAWFDLNGQVTGGPPPRPLPAYGVSEVQGKVFVSV